MKVCESECRNCLFGPERLVTDEDAADILQRVARDDSYFVCHEASARSLDVMCRGWWDHFGDRTNPGRIARRLGITPDWKPTGPVPADGPYGETLLKMAKRGAAKRARS